MQEPTDEHSYHKMYGTLCSGLGDADNMVCNRLCVSLCWSSTKKCESDIFSVFCTKSAKVVLKTLLQTWKTNGS